MLNLFLQQLHHEPEKVKPVDWQVDWEDAPLPYKLYLDLPGVALSREVPLTLMGTENNPAKPDLRTVGHFLYYTYGLSQLTQALLPPMPEFGEDEGSSLIQMCRRFVPSGGGLYPNELYLYLKIDDLPSGIYHYDAAHHRLVLLRQGMFDDYLESALGNRGMLRDCFGVAFVSTMYWKNFFKYNNFAYRLQGLDAGVVMGQLLEVGKRFGFEGAVCFQFLDRAVNHLLGLSEQEESVYAVMPLAAGRDGGWEGLTRGGGSLGNEGITAAVLCRELAEIHHRHYVRSKQVIDYPVLRWMNEASQLESASLFRNIHKSENAAASRQGTGPFFSSERVSLPPAARLTYDLAEVCRSRFSPESEFILERINRHTSGALLQETMESFRYCNDLDGFQSGCEPRVRLVGCFYNVENIPDGAYSYDGKWHVLEQLGKGDFRAQLYQGMSMHNVNPFQVPLNFHVAGSRDHLVQQLGYRGYRIQQMEAGMLVQRLLLAASASGMGGRPLLGYDVPASDTLYGLPPRGMTGLIYVPVGPFRQRSRMVGGLSC